MADYEGIDVEKRIKKVGEQEIEKALTHLAESFAQFHPVTDRDQVESGDVVRIDYTAFINGRAIPGLQGKDRLVEIGKENIFPGFQERLQGIRRGATAEFTLAFPKSDDSPGDSTRVATFRVTVHDLASKEVPSLDDEFAKDHGECATLDRVTGKSQPQPPTSCRSTSREPDGGGTHYAIIPSESFEVPPSLTREQEHRILLEAGVLRAGDDSRYKKSRAP